MVLRPQHIDTRRFQAALAFPQRIHTGHLEGDVVDPVRRIRISLHRRRAGKVEERDVAAVAAFEENVDEVDLFSVRPRAFR